MSTKVLGPSLVPVDWPAPNNIHACSTTRKGGVSEGEFASLNLAMHVEDNAKRVADNRSQLSRLLNLPSEPVWLEQVHGRQIIDLSQPVDETPQADAAFSNEAKKVCVVMTADCLPALICNKAGNKVAAAHAGWRGLASGVLESSIAAFNEPAENLMVWLGPAIGADAFEVGDEVRQAFINDLPQAEQAFKSTGNNKYMADIYLLAKQRLARAGLKNIYGGEYCTFNDKDHFFSFRRDGKTGRQASLIWFD